MSAPVPATSPSLPPLREDLRIALVLAIACALAAMAVLPYVRALMPEPFARAPVPFPVLMVLQGVQAFALFGALGLLGLRMGHRVGLGTPLLRRWLVRESAPARAPRPPVASSIALGIAAGLAIAGLAALLDPMLPPMRNPPHLPPGAATAFNGLLASFYGGIAEETLLRLFLVTLLVWLAARIRRAAPAPGAYWFAIVLAAVVFGVGHLPAAAQVWDLDALVAARTVLLNAIGGIAFGWLYWKRGLEMAIVAHFAADIVLHVLLPLAGLAPGG